MTTDQQNELRQIALELLSKYDRLERYLMCDRGTVADDLPLLQKAVDAYHNRINSLTGTTNDL
jgi:hypothetical protein